MPVARNINTILLKLRNKSRFQSTKSLGVLVEEVVEVEVKFETRSGDNVVTTIYDHSGTTIETTVKTTIEPPIEILDETPLIEAPVEATVEAPVEAPVEATVEATVEAPVEAQ